jgi:uncharacterized membrane protein YdjX (TVP38/TMEM64 family)
VRRVALALLVFAVIAAAWALGVHEQLKPAHVKELVSGAGLWGPVVFIGVFTVAEILHFPCFVLVIAAAGIWHWSIAIPTAYAGAVTASLAIFWIARRTLSDVVRDYLPERLLRFEHRLESHGLRTVILLRLLFSFAPAVHWLLGASEVRFRDYLLGTAVGLLPWIVAYVVFGKIVIRYWERAFPWLLVALAVGLSVELIRRIRARRRETRSKSPG